MRTIFFITTVVICILAITIFIPAVNAQNSNIIKPGPVINSADNTQTPSLCDPLSGVCGGPGTTPQTLIGKIINAVLGVVGSIALIMFIYGGFVWMTAAGNQERVGKGKEILVWSSPPTPWSNSCLPDLEFSGNK
jgi:hypothetical protein